MIDETNSYKSNKKVLIYEATTYLKSRKSTYELVASTLAPNVKCDLKVILCVLFHLKLSN